MGAGYRVFGTTVENASRTRDLVGTIVAVRPGAREATDHITHTAPDASVPTLPFSAEPDPDPKEDTL